MRFYDETQRWRIWLFRQSGRRVAEEHMHQRGASHAVATIAGKGSLRQPQVWLVEDEQGVADTLISAPCSWRFTLSYSLVGCPRWKKNASAAFGRMR